DGATCDFYSCLPGLQYYAELAFNEKATLKTAAQRFAGTCDSDFNAWVRAAGIEYPPMVSKPEVQNRNAAVSLLWQDPLLALVEPLCEGHDLRRFYTKLAADLESEAGRKGIASHLRFPQQI